MLRSFLKSKIHGATVTGVNLEYDGSITLDRVLIEKSGLSVFEKVLICNLENGNRFETYVIEGDEGQVEINGAAAHLAKKGDRIIVLAFGLLEEAELENHKPIVLKPDFNNKV